MLECPLGLPCTPVNWNNNHISNLYSFGSHYENEAHALAAFRFEFSLTVKCKRAIIPSFMGLFCVHRSAVKKWMSPLAPLSPFSWWLQQRISADSVCVFIFNFLHHFTTCFYVTSLPKIYFCLLLLHLLSFSPSQCFNLCCNKVLFLGVYSLIDS